MTTVAFILTALVALIHVYIVVLEMALWTTPRGRAAFGTTPEIAGRPRCSPPTRASTTGSSWPASSSGSSGRSDQRFAFAVFGLICVVVAGLYGRRR